MPALSSSRTLPPSLGPFRLIAQLGQGGFAPVWHAEEVYEGRKLRDVAIKLFFLPEEISHAPTEAGKWRDDVIDEARALCRVEHPNIVRFYTLQRDDAYGMVGLVMEYIPGRNLDDLVHQHGPLEEQKVLEIGISVAWALAAVHNAGLVHRDIKPGNIIEAASCYKLIDFGIVVDAPPPLTSHDAGGPPDPSTPRRIIGTLPFIAPEYLQRGAPPSPSGDLYALGVTLFELLTGRLPQAAPRAARELRLAREPASTPFGSALERPPATDSILDLVTLLLEPDPNARPRHADWVARELERLRARITPQRAPSAGTASATAPPGSLADGPEASAIETLFGFERRVPAPLAPLFAEIRRACQEDATSDPGGALSELGLGVLRYVFALGMALLAASTAPPLKGALADQLRSAARPTPASWCHILRALHEALSSIDPSIARLFSFAASPSLVGRLGALVRDPSPATALERWAPWLVDLLVGAEELLSLPLFLPGSDGATFGIDTQRGTEPPATADVESAALHVVLGERPIQLSPWLPQRSGQILLPEAPAAPAKPWRAEDPAFGERRDDPDLDQAVRRLLGDDAEGEATLLELQPRPPLVGRADALALLDRAAREAAEGNVRLVLLTGPLGVGRTRLLEAAVEQAGIAKGRVLQARCSPERTSPLRPLLAGLGALPQGEGVFGLLRGAIERALMPDVLAGVEQSNEALEAVEDALLRAAAEGPVLLTIDDIQWGDAHTLKLVQLLVERADHGSKAKLLVLAAARDEPNAGAPLRALSGAFRARARPGIKHLVLGPLTAPQAASLAQGVCPVDPDLERAVVRGSGGVPFFLVNALLVWRETGVIAWRKGSWRAVDERVLWEDVPGVAALVEARLASYFAPSSPIWRAALRALAAVAVHGGGLPTRILFHIGGEEEILETSLEALVDAGILVISGERQEYSFAQEMVRQAVWNLVRQRPWFYRLHRALLDAMARGPGAAEDAAFLAAGYEKLGDLDEARGWFGRAMESAISAGLFSEAAGFGDRLAALTPDPTARADVELAIARALVRGRQFEEAKARLDAGTGELPAKGPLAAARALRRRILWLEVARGRAETIDDPMLLTDADAQSDPALGCEARMALAGVALPEQAMQLASEAVALAERCGPALEFSARVLRVELTYAAGGDLQQAERDLRRALSIAIATSSLWQQIHIEGDLAVLEAERDPAAAIERLRRLSEQAEARGMRGQLRLLTHNLSTCLMREGRAAEAAEVAQRTADLAGEAGDPMLRGTALSLRAYALFCAGDLEAALTSATEAEWLQRERDDRMRPQTLLRRAVILDSMGRADEALKDVREAQEIAEFHGEKAFFVTAVLWEKLYLARRGKVTAEELRGALADAEASGVAQRALTRRLIEQAVAWLASATTGMS
jgi:eukaryotic-like serine/threonine-protein kinase